MEKLKKRTLIDKFRDAIRAFRGKPIGSIQFGIDVKRCSECDRGSDVLYLCDQKRCIKCHYPECKHTNDIRHAKNFVSCPGPQNSIYYEEIDGITEEDAMKFFEEDDTDGSGQVWQGNAEVVHKSFQCSNYRNALR